MTDTLDRFIQDTSQESESGKMQQKSSQKNSQTLTFSPQDSLARLFQSLESGSDLRSQEARYFLRLLGLRDKNDLDICYLKTLKDYLITLTGKRLQTFSQRWMSWGMMQNGRCLTASISFRKEESVCLLSDILEKQVTKEFFLSEQMTEYLIKKKNIFFVLLTF